MRSAAEIRAKEQATGAKLCTKCSKVKPLGAFYVHRKMNRLQAWCKNCARRSVVENQQTEACRARRKAYDAKPENRAKRKEYKTRRRATPEGQRKEHEYRVSPRGRLLSCRREARCKLKKATAPARIARLNELIGMYTAEIARLDKQAR